MFTIVNNTKTDQMSARYYEPKTNHLIHFGVQGEFECEQISNKDHQHTRSMIVGQTVSWKKTDVDTQLANGDIERVTTRIHGKLDRNRKDVLCNCGAVMKFKGYWVREEKIIKRGEVIGGLYTVGGESKNTIRWFKKKNKQKEYCNRRYNEILGKSKKVAN